MATPDPFMDELRIMSYCSRPRACKELYKIPRRNDFIEVLWCLDDLPGLPERWCPAEVLHVYDGTALDLDTTMQTDQSGQKRLAKGVILYLPGETWDEQVDEVDFLDGHKLRCAANRAENNEDQSDGSDVTTPNPPIRWRFREQQPGADEQDDDWENICNVETSRVKTSTLHRAQAHPSIKGNIDFEVKSLRDGHAHMTVELEKMKRELVSVTHQLKAVQNFTVHDQACTSAHCVLPRLRHKLALRMQACLKPTPATLGKERTWNLIRFQRDI